MGDLRSRTGPWGDTRQGHIFFIESLSYCLADTLLYRDEGSLDQAKGCRPYLGYLLVGLTSCSRCVFVWAMRAHLVVCVDGRGHVWGGRLVGVAPGTDGGLVLVALRQVEGRSRRIQLHDTRPSKEPLLELEGSVLCYRLCDCRVDTSEWTRSEHLLCPAGLAVPECGGTLGLLPHNHTRTPAQQGRQSFESENSGRSL